jgi:hypothetical protein
VDLAHRRHQAAGRLEDLDRLALDVDGDRQPVGRDQDPATNGWLR